MGTPFQKKKKKKIRLMQWVYQLNLFTLKKDHLLCSFVLAFLNTKMYFLSWNDSHSRWSFFNFKSLTQDNEIEQLYVGYPCYKMIWKDESWGPHIWCDQLFHCDLGKWWTGLHEATQLINGIKLMWPWISSYSPSTAVCEGNYMLNLPNSKSCQKLL